MLITSPWFLAEGRTTASRGILIEPRLSRPLADFTVVRVGQDIGAVAADQLKCSQVALLDHTCQTTIESVRDYLSRRGFGQTIGSTEAWDDVRYADVAKDLRERGLVVIPSGSVRHFLTALRALGLDYHGLENDHTWTRGAAIRDPTPEVLAFASNLAHGLNQGLGAYLFFLNQVRPVLVKPP